MEKIYKVIEATTVDGDLTLMITDALNTNLGEGWKLDDIKYSTSFDTAYNKVRSCALIVMSKGDE